MKQSPRTPPISRRAGHARSSFRSVVGLLLFLVLGTTGWQAATGSRCSRAEGARQAAVTLANTDGRAADAVHAAHRHDGGSEAPLGAPAHACPGGAAIVAPANAPSHEARDGSVPLMPVARLATSTDPPGLFRPPRSV